MGRFKYPFLLDEAVALYAGKDAQNNTLGHWECYANTLGIYYHGSEAIALRRVNIRYLKEPPPAFYIMKIQDFYSFLLTFTI